MATNRRVQIWAEKILPIDGSISSLQVWGQSLSYDDHGLGKIDSYAQHVFEGCTLIVNKPSRFTMHALLSVVHSTREGFSWTMRGLAKSLPRTPFLITNDLQVHSIYEGTVQLTMTTIVQSLLEDELELTRFIVGSDHWFGVLEILNKEQADCGVLYAFSQDAKTIIQATDHVLLLDADQTNFGNIKKLEGK